METRQRKLILIRAAKAIVDARAETIEIIRSNKMSNVCLIDRSGKSTKDPNPISSSMHLMGTKYPISIDLDKAKEMGVPKAYYTTKNGKSDEDRRRHGRVLCKKEAIDWWISESECPKDSLEEVIRIMYQGPIDEVSRYYSINWAATRIKFGPPTLERKAIRTREVSVDIPRDLRIPLLKELLFPHLCLSNERITGDMVNKLRRIASLELDSRFTLQKQIRVLLNHMDPRVRTLPIIPGLSNSLLPLKQSIMHNNFLITNICVQNSTPHARTNKSLTVFGMCLVFEAKLSKFGVDTIKDIIGGTTIENRRAIELIKEAKHCNITMWLKAAMDVKTTLEFEFGPVTLCPFPSNVKRIMRETKSGIRYHTCKGKERYNFKMGDIRGSFEREESFLMSIITNYTLEKDLTYLLSYIAAYLKVGASDSSAKSEEELEQEIRAEISLKPWTFIGCRKGEYENMNRGKSLPLYLGRLTIQENTEYTDTGKYQTELDENLDVKIMGTHQKFSVRVKEKDLKLIPETVTMKSTLLVGHLPFTKMLKNRVLNFYLKGSELRKRVKARDFRWSNVAFKKFAREKAGGISRMARDLLIKIDQEDIWDPSYCAFLYVFCHANPGEAVAVDFTFNIGPNQVDLLAREGVFMYNEDKGRYELFGIKIMDHNERVDFGKVAKGMLPGYLLSLDIDAEDRIVTQRYLEKEAQNIQVGESFTTYLFSTRMRAVRDTRVAYQTSETYNERLAEIFRERSIFHDRTSSRKRQWFSEQDEDGPSQKKIIKWGGQILLDEGIMETEEDVDDLFESGDEDCLL